MCKESVYINEWTAIPVTYAKSVKHEKEYVNVKFNKQTCFLKTWLRYAKQKLINVYIKKMGNSYS